MEPLTEFSQLLDRWHREVFTNSEGDADPVSILTSIAELIEHETETYLKMPIDPFDERHPSRTNPECSFGQILKALFKNESFMNSLTTEYIMSRSNFNLHVISCRLLLDILPGLESSVVFMESEDLVEKLLEWSDKADFPLNSYATGLLAAAMEVAEISSKYREQNNQLVPIMLNRLRDLTPSTASDQSVDDIDPRCFSNGQRDSSSLGSGSGSGGNRNNKINHSIGNKLLNNTTINKLANNNDTPQLPPPPTTRLPNKRLHDDDAQDNHDITLLPLRKQERRSSSNMIRSPIYNECSNSSWAEAHMSGSYQMHPLSTIMQQRFILQYLTTMGDFQEMLVHMFEHKALSHILYFINWRKNQDIRLAFDALKFLASLLTHKKFALEFLNHGGLQQLLRVNRQAMASSGVAICLYYLAYNEDVMERICWMPHSTDGSPSVVEDMVSYGLWLLECSHDSSRCHATMFFSLCFQFPLLLRLFDKDNGLRKLLNVISMRGLFSDDPMIHELSEDEICSRRHTAKHVCYALRKYARAHFIKETMRFTRTNSPQADSECKPIGLSDEIVLDCVELHRQAPIARYNWKALDRMVQEDGVMYILKLIAHYCDETMFFAGKPETIRNALEVLLVCSLAPRVQQLLLKEVIRINTPYPIEHPALTVIVMCADPKIMDADCQKSALNILINLVSTNLSRTPISSMVNGKSVNIASTPASSTKTIPGSSKKRSSLKNFIDLSAKLRNAAWANNGTMTLPKLLTYTPSHSLTEADAIRALACRALCGLAREENIRQIMSKLPLFTDGQLQTLMKEPILQEKKIEHSTFCKFCKELIELVTGTPVASLSGVEPSLDEIKRRLIVSQTKIVYNEDEAFYLIHNYLVSKGLTESAALLFKEAKLANKSIKTHSMNPLNPIQNRLTSRPSNLGASNQASSSNTSLNESLNQSNNQGSIPTHFKLNKISCPNGSSTVMNHTPRTMMMQKSRVQPTPLYRRLNEQQNNQPIINLDSILAEYLRNQHGLCKNPVATCPPFDLLAPHRCPEPSNRRMAPLNIASRIRMRQIYPPRGGMNGAKYDRQYIYSKFRPLKLVRDSIDSKTNNSTCCAFSYADHFLFVGTQNGLLKAFNINTGVVEASYNCHNGPLGYIGPSQDGTLIITTSPVTATPVCLLWTFTDIFERKLRFDNDVHAEFGKTSSHRVISTQELYARLWDITTGQMIQKYECNHRYLCNRGTMNYDDSLVLNDGTLWDVRSASVVHKFGKFNERINGIFHPNGNEIISNSHVWDLRNFRLLRTVPAFDGCQLKFNSTGDVIFSTIIDDQVEEPPMLKDEFKTSFRTFDSHDYSTIATIDFKRTISDLAVNPTDQYIALVESSGNLRYADSYMTESNVCRLYEIGRSKYSEDIDMADDQDEDGDDEDDDDDDEDDEDDDDEDDVVNLEYDEDEDELNIMGTDEEDEGSDVHSSDGSASSDDELVPFRFGQSSYNDSHVDNEVDDEDDSDDYEEIDE